MTNEHDRIDEQAARAERASRREQLVKKIRELGGDVPESNGDPSEMELVFLERVVAWETRPVSTHGEWLAQRGYVFEPPDALRGPQLEKELWRLIKALAVARVFLEHTDHLGDTELYARLWNEVLDADAPDFARTPEDACHWDFADAGAGQEQIWLTYYASEAERQDWVDEFPEVVLPSRKTPPCRRDFQLPVAE
jgi:hypothetical protein